MTLALRSSFKVSWRDSTRSSKIQLKCSSLIWRIQSRVKRFKNCNKHFTIQVLCSSRDLLTKMKIGHLWNCGAERPSHCLLWIKVCMIRLRNPKSDHRCLVHCKILQSSHLSKCQALWAFWAMCRRNLLRPLAVSWNTCRLGWSRRMTFVNAPCALRNSDRSRNKWTSWWSWGQRPMAVAVARDDF